VPDGLRLAGSGYVTYPVAITGMPHVKTKKRAFQFSLQSLLLLMLAASIGLSFIAVRVQKARKELAEV